MEEILNKIIEIDNSAKKIIEEKELKQKNIEDYIEVEFNKKKAMLDLEYKTEIENKTKRYQEMFEQKKNEIDSIIVEKLEKLEKIYRENEQTIIKQIVNKIKNEEE